MNIQLKTCLFIFLFLVCCVHTGCCGYTTTVDQDVGFNAHNFGGGEFHPFWNVPLWIKIVYILALITGIFAAVKFLPPFAGRIKSVLENDKRREILDYIFENPGRCFEEIALEMDLNRDSLRYHIKRLRQANYVVIENTDNSKRIFPNHGTFSDLERKIISICRNPMQLKIIALITKYPGIRNIDLKEELRISRSAVSWHIGKLEKAGLLSSRKSGTARHYYIKSGLEKVIAENLPEEIRKDYGSFA
jgi:predicted transcriptional regulator